MIRNGSLWKAFSVVVSLTLFQMGCVAQAVPGQVAQQTPPPQPTVGSAPSAPSAPSPSPKAEEKPKYGGIVTRVMNRDVPSFDVQREGGADASQTLFNVYEGLVRFDPIQHEKVMPELAETWEISPDGKVYTFKFHKDIKWHDGKPFSMEDVKYNLERMHNPKAFKTISPRGEPLLAAMDSVDIVNTDTIKITTQYPSASFLLNLATGWVAIAPKEILVAKGDMRRDAVGTGPFKLKEFNPNVSLELQRNQSYYVKGVPYLDGIKFYTIKDDATRFSAFRTGQIKITFIGSGGLSAAQTEIVRKDMLEKATVYEHDAITRNSITFNLHHKAFADVRVRKAVDLAFDRQAALKVQGKGYLGSIYSTPWGMPPDEVGKLPGYRQPKDADLAEAKKLMAEAGYAEGFKTTLMSRTGGATEGQAVVAKDQLAKIGIDAELVLLEPAAVYERADRRSFDLLNFNWADNTGEPSETLFTYYTTGGSRNYGDYSDKMVDELADKQARTLDEAARKSMLREIQKKIMDQVPMIVVFWDVWHTGAWKEVKNFTPGPGIHPWGKYDQMWLSGQ